MESFLDCLPCIVGQCVRAARFATDDERLQRRALNVVLEHLTEADLTRTPIDISLEPHRIVRAVTGCADPYAELRERSNADALALYPRLKSLVAESDDPLMTALRIAAAGNIMDFGALASFDVEAALDRALTEPFAIDHSQAFRGRLAESQRVLYLADNAGEIVFDRVLLEELGERELVVAVKSDLFINDALLADAMQVGLDEVARLIEVPPGADRPELFLGEWERADIIISKGQANYEALREARGPLFLLLIIKCPVLAADAGVDGGSMVLVSAEAAQGKQTAHSR